MITVSKTPNTLFSFYKEITGVTVIAKSVSTKKYKFNIKIFKLIYSILVKKETINYWIIHFIFGRNLN